MKNQNQLLTKAVMVFVIVFSMIGTLKAQTPSEFWSAFEKCTQAAAFQANYPTLSGTQTRVHALMNHGIDVPSLDGITFSSAVSFEVYDKSTMIGLGKTNFFLIHDMKISGTQATFDVVYYYNFNGSYDQFVAAVVSLEKVNGVWTISNTTVK
jgi:hypothetical protein